MASSNQEHYLFQPALQEQAVKIAKLESKTDNLNEKVTALFEMSMTATENINKLALTVQSIVAVEESERKKTHPGGKNEFLENLVKWLLIFIVGILAGISAKGLLGIITT